MRTVAPDRRGNPIAQLSILLVAATLVACAGSPNQPPENEDGIRIRRVTADGAVGFAATIRLAAAPGIVERWLLDFDHIAPDRPNVLEAALVEEEPDGWLARFRFRGFLGIDVTAVTRTKRRVEGGAVILEFASVETSFGLSRLSGSYRIEPRGSGGCLLTHVLYLESPFVSEAGRARDMREDAEAIARRFR